MSAMLTGTKHARGYSRLFVTGLINGIGDRFSSVALLAMILELTGSGMAVGISLGLRVLPYLFMAPLGGFLAGKLPRKRIMIALDVLRAPAALSLILVDGAGRLWLAYLVSFLLAAGEAVYSPVRKSAIPLLAGPDKLLRINSLEQLMNGCVLIVGAFAGGVVSYWFGPETGFVLNAASFLVAALLLAGIRFPDGAEPSGSLAASAAVSGGEGQEHARPGRRQSLKWLAGSSLVLQVVIGYELLVPLFNGWDNVLISVYAVEVFHAGDVGVGALYAALGIGLSLSALAERLLRRRLLAVALAGLLMEGILLMGISFSGGIVSAFILYILLALCGGIGAACLDTLVMRETPASLQPVLFGMLSAAGNSLMGLSMLAAGWLLDVLEPRELGLTGGACFAAIAVLLGSYAYIRGRGLKSGEGVIAQD
ncbi:MFS transporter ['Paenibacillus yunnanensis' Narsing Rao et al. 2020]|uniref:MFS transporter n=1 Tax=Paenibacillus tengchongensis TaxID=2608684 RepID=UPI00124D902C|nr:MFS transporter [Paenibacillus tengchongensis]